MQKRGQVSIFLILGIIIVFLFGLSFYVENYGAKKKSRESVIKSIESADANIVKVYADTCLNRVSVDALFDKIGLQGGYINPDGVPTYLNGDEESIPDLDFISRELGNYIVAEFENCFETKLFSLVTDFVKVPISSFISSISSLISSTSSPVSFTSSPASPTSLSSCFMSSIIC